MFECVCDVVLFEFSFCSSCGYCRLPRCLLLSIRRFFFFVAAFLIFTLISIPSASSRECWTVVLCLFVVHTSRSALQHKRVLKSVAEEKGKLVLYYYYSPIHCRTALSHTNVNTCSARHTWNENDRNKGNVDVCVCVDAEGGMVRGLKGTHRYQHTHRCQTTPLYVLCSITCTHTAHFVLTNSHIRSQIHRMPSYFIRADRSNQAGVKGVFISSISNFSFSPCVHVWLSALPQLTKIGHSATTHK